MPGRHVPGPLSPTISDDPFSAPKFKSTRTDSGNGAFEPSVPIGMEPPRRRARQAPTDQERAKSLIDEFAERIGIGVFPSVARRDVAAGLKERIDDPGKINQSMTSLCGPASILFDLAGAKPLTYAQFGIDLYEVGVANIGKLHIVPGADLRVYAPPAGIDAADWITLASIRDSENWFFDYEAVGNELAGITLPHELADWFRSVGYTDVRNDTNLVINKDEANAREASNLFQRGFRVSLFIGANLLEKPGSGSPTADHWVVLVSPIRFEAGTIEMHVFSWGNGRRRVPLQGVLLTDAFLKNYYGYVAARM